MGLQGNGDAVPAKRAIWIVLQPHIDAVDMKDMGAVGYDSQLLVVLKLGQTDGAFAGIFMFLKLEDGDGADDGFVETSGLGRRKVVGDEWVVVVVSTPGKGEAAEDINSMPVKAAFNNKDVVKDEEKDGGKDSNNGNCYDWETGMRRMGIWRFWRRKRP